MCVCVDVERQGITNLSRNVCVFMCKRATFDACASVFWAHLGGASSDVTRSRIIWFKLFVCQRVDSALCNVMSSNLTIVIMYY